MERFLGLVRQIRRSRRRKGKRYRPEEDYHEGYEDVYYYTTHHLHLNIPPSNLSNTDLRTASVNCFTTYWTLILEQDSSLLFPFLGSRWSHRCLYWDQAHLEDDLRIGGETVVPP
ncbi:hypothetical protein GJAV_G00269150 [Gymnothorax javanicus]|nr:hypothetical protein GJAV_G00269150 [Gymnothorax javanicus]